MLLRQFKGTGPVTITLIIVTLLAVWASAFIMLPGHFSLYFDLYPMPLYGLLSSVIGTHPLPGILFTLSIVSLVAFLMANLNTSLFFINERTYLPAVIYILLSGLFPEYQLLNPAIFGAIFLMLAITRLMAAHRVPGVAYSFFDAGILIGTGSLFYANLIWFGLIVFVGMYILRTGNITEIFISVVGLITPFVMTFGIYYLLGYDLKNLISILEFNLLNKPDSYVFTRLTIATISFISLGILVSMAHLLMLINTKKIRSRKTFYLLIWLFTIAIAVYIFLPSVSVEIVWIMAVPVSYFLSHFFVFVRKKLIPEIFFSVLFILIFVIQVFYLI